MTMRNPAWVDADGHSLTIGDYVRLCTRGAKAAEVVGRIIAVTHTPDGPYVWHMYLGNHGGIPLVESRLGAGVRWVDGTAVPNVTRETIGSFVVVGREPTWGRRPNDHTA